MGDAKLRPMVLSTQCVAPVLSDTVLTTVSCRKALNNAIAQFFAHL